MNRLILIRHGESIWNRENRFTGHIDVDLSPQGISEAKEAAAILKRHNLTHFHVIYTSLLKRAIHTATIIREELGPSSLELIENWRLNERHYGALQGKNKREVADIHGAKQVALWRRSYRIRPPLLDKDEAPPPRGGAPLILGESLEDTYKRVIPYWNDEISKKLTQGKDILIVAHGNSLRALMKHLFFLSDDEIVKLEIPTGRPLLCQLDDDGHPLAYQYLT